jgi:uncharacterized membrane protein
VRDYFYGNERYIPFFERNYSWVLIPFVFLSVVLSAMQVGAGLDPLGKNDTFLSASYGVALFSMICVLVLVAPLALLPVFNLVVGLIFSRNKSRNDSRMRREMTRERLESQS